MRDHVQNLLSRIQGIEITTEEAEQVIRFIKSRVRPPKQSDEYTQKRAFLDLMHRMVVGVSLEPEEAEELVNTILSRTPKKHSDKEEALAEYAHDAWSGWMKYLFSQCEWHIDDDGTVIMPAWAVERWLRQMKTPYAELSEQEKESDRAEARKMLLALERVEE